MKTQEMAEESVRSARCEAGVREIQLVRVVKEEELLTSSTSQKRQVRMQGMHQAGTHVAGCFDSKIA